MRFIVPVLVCRVSYTCKYTKFVSCDLKYKQSLLSMGYISEQILLSECACNKRGWCRMYCASMIWRDRLEALAFALFQCHMIEIANGARFCRFSLVAPCHASACLLGPVGFCVRTARGNEMSSAPTPSSLYL